jgi:hypothetical protein
MHRHAGLVEVSVLVEAGYHGTPEGWNRESSRLFAIDVAMLTCRQSLGRLNDRERTLVMVKLNEARRLVVDSRDPELEWVLNELEPELNTCSDQATRPMWLTLLNALLPCPYRAAVATCRSALLATGDDGEELTAVLRERLTARIGEGELLQPPVAVA